MLIIEDNFFLAKYAYKIWNWLFDQELHLMKVQNNKRFFKIFLLNIYLFFLC